ncbi:hypothetical protein [Streptomyces sp. NPDC001876]|uniref:hypothetical protein n=1 Tax=Streptomyces sp. NPDC001876 TaxID=3154402 RepID=UPI0033294667
MPRRSPGVLRAGPPDRQTRSRTSTLLIGACPGPPVCTAVHTYLFVDGLEVIGRSDSRAVGLRPDELLRPGGPLYPAEAARSVGVASSQGHPGSEPTLHIRVRLRGATVLWSELMYPGRDEGVIEEVCFDLEQYVGEIERAYGLCATDPAGPSG